jgi:hypothetical protein
VEVASGPDPAERSLSLEELKEVWPAVLDNLRQTAPALAATFDGAHPVAFEDDELRIGFPAEFTFNKRKAEAPDKREAVATALETVLGSAILPVYVLLDTDEESGGANQEEAGGDGMDPEALVEKLKSEFNAEEVG